MKFSIDPINRTLLHILAGNADAAAELAALSSWEQAELVRRAAAQYVLPVMAGRLGAGKGLAAETAAAMRRAALETEAVNLGRLVQLETILKAFQAAGVAVIALKGLHLALGVYERPYERTMGDFDFLVRTADLPAAADVLVRLGYAASRRYEPDTILTLHRHMPPYRRAHWPTVELHWSIVEPEHPFTIEAEGLWGRCGAVTVGEGLRMGVLAPGDLLMHLCIHAVYDHRLHMGLRPLVDVQAAIGRAGAALDWTALADGALAAGAGRPTALMLRLGRELLGAPVPDSVFERLGAPEVEAGLLEASVDLLFSEYDFKPEITPDLAEVMQGGGVIRRVRIVLGRIFLSRRTMAKIYPVRPDSAKVWLFYPVRLGYLVGTYGRALVARLRGDPEARRQATAQARRNEEEAQLAAWLEEG